LSYFHPGVNFKFGNRWHAGMRGPPVSAPSPPGCHVPTPRCALKALSGPRACVRPNSHRLPIASPTASPRAAPSRPRRLPCPRPDSPTTRLVSRTSAHMSECATPPSLSMPLSTPSDAQPCSYAVPAALTLSTVVSHRLSSNRTCRATRTLPSTLVSSAAPPSTRQ
jgi:hypothetical protein